MTLQLAQSNRQHVTELPQEHIKEGAVIQNPELCEKLIYWFADPTEKLGEKMFLVDLKPKVLTFCRKIKKKMFQAVQNADILLWFLF